jgi:ribosomal protein S18 acetylase RimI-like enzyme
MREYRSGQLSSLGIMSIDIKRMEEHDWQVARALRLRALAEDPDAFAATLEDERTLPDTQWRARASANAAGERTLGLLALQAGVAVGLAVGVRAGDTGEQVELNALWVAPEARRQGAARALVEAVASWARALGASFVTLEVTLTSHAALALYRQLGFEDAEQRTCGARQAPSIRMRRAVERGDTR